MSDKGTSKSRIVAFGAYPIANYIEGRYKVNKALMIIITCVWFDASLYVFYLFIKLIITDIAFINEYIIPIIAIAASVCVFWISDNDEKAATENRFAIWQTALMNALMRPWKRIRGEAPASHRTCDDTLAL